MTPPATTSPGVDLMLGPATRLLWRSPDTVHLELGSKEVVVEGLPLPVIRRVATSGRVSPSAPAVDEPTRTTLAGLADAGYLWPRRSGHGGHHDRAGAPPVPRLAGELTALAARHGRQAAEVLDARRVATVAVHGSSRLAPHLAAVLGAAGVGRVHCVVDGDAGLRHLQPGGVDAADEGRPLIAAAHGAIVRAAPDADATPLPADERPDLTVLALDAPVSDARRLSLHAADAAHLVVQVGVDHGVIGPLVLPGLTSCVRCADLHRQDRDPAWAALAVQFTVPHRHGPASPVALSTLVAGAAALQALAFLDGDDPAAIEATLEFRLPDWRLRRRSRPPHVDCGCISE